MFLHPEVAFAELAGLKIASSLPSAPRFRCVWTDPYSGPCKINAPRALSTRPPCSVGEGFSFPVGGSARPPRPPLFKVERRARGTQSRSERLFCKSQSTHYPSTLYPGGRGGAPETWITQNKYLGLRTGVCASSRQDGRLFCKDRTLGRVRRETRSPPPCCARSKRRLPKKAKDSLFPVPASCLSSFPSLLLLFPSLPFLRLSSPSSLLAY